MSDKKVILISFFSYNSIMVYCSGSSYMNKLMTKLMKFMYGRYGTDQLSRFLIFLGLVLSIIDAFMPRLYILAVIADILFIFAIYRMFSKNIVRRTKENDTFLHVLLYIRRHFRACLSSLKDHEHRYYVCPHCLQITRVPKEHGKITITCPSCHQEFDRKS